MHSRFDRFRRTPLGQQLEALCTAPQRYLEYAALARAGVPSILAITHEVAHKFAELANDTTARQFCGALVAEVMRQHGHSLVQARGRASGSVFTYGAVFSPHPVAAGWTELLAALARFPQQVSLWVADWPTHLQCTRPQGTGFALVEHLCHLRDLDAVYRDRLQAVLTTDLPELPDVDGTALAQTRDYLNQPLAPALAQWCAGRAGLCDWLGTIPPESRQRCGLRDRLHRTSVQEWVQAWCQHDATHALELQELRAELDPLDTPENTPPLP